MNQQLSEDFPESSNLSPSEGGRLRSDSLDSDVSRESFLDNVPARASFSFKRQQRQEARLMAEDVKFEKYRFKLKAISLFFVILSVFILLNASIGASSAPFYDKETDCSRYELTESCEKLNRFTKALYGFEVIGSIILVVHGVLGMTLLDYIKRRCLIRVMQIYTKVALFLYMLDALLRTAMYFKIKHLLVDETASHEKLSFAGYLAVYCENEALGVIISAILFGLYSICFLSTCYMWRLTDSLHQTALEVEKDRNRALERKKGGSFSGTGRTSSGEGDEEKQENELCIEEEYPEDPTSYYGHHDHTDEDYEQSARAKRASQVILDINASYHENQDGGLLIGKSYEELEHTRSPANQVFQAHHSDGSDDDQQQYGASTF